MLFTVSTNSFSGLRFGKSHETEATASASDRVLHYLHFSGVAKISIEVRSHSFWCRELRKAPQKQFPVSNNEQWRESIGARHLHGEFTCPQRLDSLMNHLPPCLRDLLRMRSFHHDK